MRAEAERSIQEVANQVGEALEVIGRSASPVGARSIRKQFGQQGLPGSESTVSRLLQSFDAEGWTKPVGNKGRVLTTAGQAQLHRLRAIRRQQNATPLDIRSIRDLQSLLVARRAVERENVREAAIHMRREDIRRLRRATDQHLRAIERGEVPRSTALAFHTIVGAASGNKFLSALTDVVFDEALDATEATLDIIVGSHRTEPWSVKEHTQIIDAIEAKDSDWAEQVMLLHINRLIDQVDEFRVRNDEDVFDRLLHLSWQA